MRLTLLGILLAALGAPARAYVDYTPTLGKLMRDAREIALVEVSRVSPDAGAVIFSRVRDLKGTLPDAPIRHQLAAGVKFSVPRHILDLARPGRRAVLFLSGRSCLVCLGDAWYQAHPIADGWWRLTLVRPDLPLAYCGSVTRLAGAIEQMLAGKQVVITTLVHGANGVGAAFDVALNRVNLPGARHIQRIRASLNMPDKICYVSADPASFVGLGAADPSDLPALMRSLSSQDPQARIDAADDLQSLGPRARPAADRLAALLQDAPADVRFHAAAALASVSPSTPGWQQALRQGMHAPDPHHRCAALQCAAAAASAITPLLDDLIRCLDDPDPRVRSAAILALASVGPAASAAQPRLVKLMDDPEVGCEAADCLGRLGASARPALPALAKRLESSDPAMQQAAVRAMAQIGGPGARPAVDFLLREIDRAYGRDLYNISVYLGLLGPVAEPAMPALERMRRRDRELCAMALWAIQPAKRFPWQWGYFADRDIDRWLFEAYIREMDGRARPGAVALAQAIVSGDSASMPSWGYQLLIDYPDEALPILQQAVKGTDPAARKRAIAALGRMGSAARPARPSIEAATKDADPRTRFLAAFVLRQIDQP